MTTADPSVARPGNVPASFAAAGLAKPARDHRIDFFRGLALASIFINHMPGNAFERLTHKNFGITDSAEIFVLLAGVAAAFAYLPGIAAGQYGAAVWRALQRAVTLYLAHLSNTAVGLGLFAAGALWLGTAPLLNELNLPLLFSDTARTLVGIPLMTHQIGYFNILPLYVTLLLMLPAILALVTIGPRVALAASLAVYALSHASGLNVPTFPAEGSWYFNPLAWQLIFTIGILIGWRLRAGLGGVPYVAPLFWLAAAYLVACFSYTWFNLWGLLPDLPLPATFVGNDKTYVAIARLAHVLALVYVVGHSPLMPWLSARLTPRNPLVLIGRHALPVFWTGTLLSVAGLIVRYAVLDQDGTLPMPEMPPLLWLDTVLVAAGLAIQVALAHALDRFERGKPAVVRAAA
ncbi:OpgC family protein [Methylobrevis albus]|uniref:OpgC domain-containing protein n=1 Tax=Methylobrevis albus TaxID=2793297 RepID=A0A931I4J5_9HYPH|nr:OpgC domain-containing protein [Methylobrevis albus]MBH0239399.1 OpgC domain-containing protein [Methylobrevis albus]